MVAIGKCRAPRRVRVTLDGGPAQHIDPRVLEREHHEHDPEWTREAKPLKRSDDAGFAAWGKGGLMSVEDLLRRNGAGLRPGRAHEPRVDVAVPLGEVAGGACGCASPDRCDGGRPDRAVQGGGVMDNDIRKDYGPAGCAGTSVALASLLALLVAMIRPGKRRGDRR